MASCLSQWQIPVHKCGFSKMKCCVKRFLPGGILFNNPVWMLAVVKIALSMLNTRLTHFLSLCLFLYLSATRESAFVHAIASAGVAFAVTRSCAEGTSTMCGCDSHHKGPPGEGWKWGGCSEDAEFGVLVSREFADARENRPDARSAMNRHNNEAGRTVKTFSRI